MKRKIFATLAMCLCTAFYAYSDDPKLCFDLNFSDAAWLDAFAEKMGQDIRTIPLTGTEAVINVPDGTLVTVDGLTFSFNGNLHRYRENLENGDPNPFISVCGLPFQYNFRLRNNQGTNILFPPVENAGKITVYVRNQNPDTDVFLNLRKKNAEGTWDIIHTWQGIPGNTSPAYNGFDDYELTYELPEGVGDGICEFSIQRIEGRFLQIYRIVLEQKGDNTAIAKPQANDMDVFTSDGILYVRSNEQRPVTINIYDLIGRNIFQSLTSEEQITLPAVASGIYAVTITDANGSLFTKKIKL